MESPAEEVSETFDQSLLTLKSEDRGNVKDVWRRPSIRPLPSDNDIVLRFEIPFARVLPPEGEQNNTKKFVVYDICARQDDCNQHDPQPATIERRYTDFLKLYEAFKKEYSAVMQSVTFPKKVMMGNFTVDLISERSAAFETFLDYIVTVGVLRDSVHFLEFLQGEELSKACQLLDERRNEQAVPILENCFRLLNKVYLDKSKPVLLLLCRLVAACTTAPVPHPSAEKWCELAIRRYEHVCDTELLVLYIPLLHTVIHLWWQRGRDNKQLEQRLTEMGQKGIKVKGGLTLSQAIHAMDARAETI